MKVVAMWSGGKDSYLAFQETISKGIEVSTLFNYVFKNDKSLLNKILSLFNYMNRSIRRSIPHEIAPEIITLQAQAMEMPLIQWETTLETFEDKLKTMIRKLKSTAIEGVIWGVEEGNEIEAHRDQLQKICDELGIKLIMPLCGKSEEQILKYFTEKGFEAIIVVVDPNLLSEEWLGHKIDHNFLREIRRLSRERSIPSGSIEYHTLVTDAPLFKKRLHIQKSRKTSKNGYSVLEISKVELIEKTEVCKSFKS